MRLPWLENLLRLALALQCVAAAGSILATGSPFGTFMFLDLGLSDPTTRALDRGIACALAMAAAAVLVSRRRALFFALTTWFALESVLAAHNGGFFAASLAPFARAIRYLAPLALAAMLTDEPARAKRLLTWGTAYVFAAHGVEALLLNPRFVDFLIVSVDRATGVRMLQSVAEYHLYAIGVVDVALAVLVIYRPGKAVWGYMAFWGLATALMRTVYYGPEIGWHHTLIRVLNGAAPLALLLAARSPAPAPVAEETGMGQTWPEPTPPSP